MGRFGLRYFYANDIVAADFNSDGKLDLAVSDNSLTIFLGKGDGKFEPRVDYGSHLSLQGLHLGDFKEDGKLDIVGSEQGGGWPHSFPATAMVLSTTQCRSAALLKPTGWRLEISTTTDCSTWSSPTILAMPIFYYKVMADMRQPRRSSLTI